VVMACPQLLYASVMLGNGDGTFQPPVNYDSPGYPWSAAVADVNDDGIPDLVVANYCQAPSCLTDGSAGVFLGNGDGTFQPVVTYDSGSPRSTSVAVADLRGDGILDLVAASGYRSTVVSVLLGNGDGTFQAPVDYDLGGTINQEVVIGDLNGDGIPDLAVVDVCKNFKKGACIGNGQVRVLLGNGDGTFQVPVTYSSGGYGGWAIAIGDVNGDGRSDLVVANNSQSPSNPVPSVAVLLNETYYASKTALTSSPNPSQVNQTVTFTATITPTPPNGELVTFYDGKTDLGTGATTNGVATLTTSFSAAKTYTIKFTYPGDPFRKPSKATVKQVVNP
ncbi:MAG: FG-GAP-like repeat-containing protein, partial [Terriglobales bacterium]